MDPKAVAWSKKWEALNLALRWTYEASGWLTVVVIGIAIFGGLLTIIEPYVFKKIIDYLVAGTNPSFAGRISLGLVGILIIYGVARVLQQTFWDATNIIRRAHSLRVEKYIMHKMMENISSLDLEYFEDSEYYNTLSRATENIYRILQLFWGFTIFVGETVSVAVIVGALFTFDWRIVGLILAGAIPGIVITLKSADTMWSAFQDSSPVFRHAHYYRGLLTERPEAMKEIRMFGLQQHFLSKFRNLFGEFLQKQDRAATRQFVGYIFLSIAEGALSVFAAWLVVNAFFEGRITVGEVTFFWAILFQFASHARWMVRQLGDMNVDAVFLVPVVEVLKFKPKIVEPAVPRPFPRKIKQGIEFRNVTFSYPRAKKPALRNVNLTINAQESVALVGENGSGKTTLIKLLCRLYDVSDGEILIDGTNIKEFALRDLYENLGVIFQDFMKYEALVEENIRFGKIVGEKAQSVHAASVKAGAWEFIKDLEKRYKTQVGKVLKKEGVELSVGQWQKIALARAFFKDAQFLILDEPTAAVDAKAEYELFQKFRHLTKNKITVLISHRFSTVRMANKILVVEKGRIIETGSHEELMRKNGMYAKLFKLQAKGYR